MKKLYMRRLNPCFGKKKMFFKEQEGRCKNCQFKRKCLLQIKGRLEDD